VTAYRLPNRGRVDHARPVSFTVDGKSYQGLAGDTLASALLANGVHLMGRSFKYHRPRGVVSAGSDEPNALVGTRRGEYQNARYTWMHTISVRTRPPSSGWARCSPADTSATDSRISQPVPRPRKVIAYRPCRIPHCAAC